MRNLLLSSSLVAAVYGRALVPRQANAAECPGYLASNLQYTTTGLSARLTLAGPACNSYGKDIENLSLIVNYDNGG